MKIGIIGSGHIGSTLANLFAKSESGKDQIAISNSRGPESIKDLTKSLGTNVIPMTPEETVKFGNVIVLAIPWIKRQELPDSKLFEDKIVIDATNPYSENLEIIDLEKYNTSSSEEIAQNKFQKQELSRLLILFITKTLLIKENSLLLH